ncbi:unnamed protein product [Euphydryas editha]|uniref:Uncharacterized protein n=1 Tax=Euphydryas editha TaxID=104508 RepID=A0AAU9UR35_EUPED|nr:unnamed protein product [Euphydryas editha]
MTSPRRCRKGGHSVIPHLDWDSPSAATGTVKRRRSSCPEHSSKGHLLKDEGIFEAQTPSDSGSGTSKSFDETDKSDSLVEVEERISCMINENRSSQSNSESSDVDIIDSILENPVDEELFVSNDFFKCESSKTFIKPHDTLLDRKCLNSIESVQRAKERKIKTPLPIKKLNKSLDIGKSTKTTNIDRINEKSSVLPIYKSTLRNNDIELSGNPKRKSSKLKLPFSPVKAMDKPKFFHGKTTSQEIKPSPLLASPVRRTISNEYVRLKFGNDTVVRRTIDGKSIQKITPKIQSIIPESPIDNEDPFLNLSPNKKYTVTVNNKVRCDKDNYVIFDPNTGFKPDETPKRTPPKAGEKSRIPLKSPSGDKAIVTRKSVNVSDTDSGILSPNSPGETSEKVPTYYVNAAVFSETAKKSTSELDIQILDPAIAKKATEQIRVS